MTQNEPDLDQSRSGCVQNIFLGQKHEPPFSIPSDRNINHGIMVRYNQSDFFGVWVQLAEKFGLQNTEVRGNLSRLTGFLMNRKVWILLYGCQRVLAEWFNQLGKRVFRQVLVSSLPVSRILANSFQKKSQSRLKFPDFQHNFVQNPTQIPTRSTGLGG